VSDATSLLYDLPGFRVVSVESTPLGVRQMVIMGVAHEHGCPRCGVLVGGRPYDIRDSRVKDLPVGHRRIEVVWRKRRYRCDELACSQRVFTERSKQIPPRHRLTGRLRERLEQAASYSARALSDVATEYGVSWWSVQHSLVVTAAARTPAELPPVRMLGLDETRARSMRWNFDPEIGRWRLSDPWMTSFVDLDVGRPGWLLGLMPGRSGATVTEWLSAVLATDHPTNQIGAAWGAIGVLRQLLTRTEATTTRPALFAFYDPALLADLPETTRLAETIQTCWPAIEAFLRLPITNARTEGANRVIKQIKQAGCGHRNQRNYEPRILLHVAAKSAA